MGFFKSWPSGAQQWRFQRGEGGVDNKQLTEEAKFLRVEGRHVCVRLSAGKPSSPSKAGNHEIMTKSAEQEVAI